MTTSKLNKQTPEEIAEQIQQLHQELQKLNEKFHQHIASNNPVDEQTTTKGQEKSKSEQDNESELKPDHLHTIIENVTRDQPLSGISIAAGIGFLVGILTRR